MEHFLDIKPDPDFSRLWTAVLRQGEPDRVPFAELFADREIMEAVVGEPLPRLFGLSPETADREAQAYYLDRVIKFYYMLGYDYVPAGVGIPFSLKPLAAEDTAEELARGERLWINESRGLINSREDFESYIWPEPEDIDYWEIEYVSSHLPEGMQVIAETSGVLESVMWLMSYQSFAFALMDDPELVSDMFEHIGRTYIHIYQNYCEMDKVGAVWLGDDMAHRGGTMISPEHLRKYVFPWQKKLVEITHRNGLPFLLHSCGNLREVMEDLIENVGIDARHSFEDTIEPVTEAKARYGDRIGIMGGIDVNFLCRANEDEVRSYVRRVIDECAPGGGYALGTGNSVANYIPLRNYLTILDEGWKYGRYPLG